jgi:rod shape-determining protein MreD
MKHTRDDGILFAASVAVAFLLQLMPLPQALLPLKPYWLALVLGYWTLEATEQVNLGRAFVIGLIADALAGDLLGEQALRLCILSFLLLRFRARLRFFPMWQQTLAILALLINDRVVLVMVRVAAGPARPSAGFWLAPFVGALAWPWLFLLLDDLRARLRARES